MKYNSFIRLALMIVTLAATSTRLAAADAPSIFDRKNLAALWIVPYDAKKRGPEERALMLKDLGLSKLAYDWRAEHVGTFDAEVEAMQKHGIEISAWWYPSRNQQILDAVKRGGIHPQFWVCGSRSINMTNDTERIEAEAARIKPIAEDAVALGCKVGLYNHREPWFEDQDHQIAIIDRLKRDGITNVGIVFNFHHWRGSLAEFPALFKRIQPYLIAVNLNGMRADTAQYPSVRYIGSDASELEMIRVVEASGWRGPVGIIHERGNMDAAEGLKGNLQGLEWVKKELRKPGSGGPKPQEPQTAAKGATSNKKTNRLLDYTIKYPEELDTPYSLDAPHRKTFREEEKQRQIADGERILAELLAAEKAGKDEYVIPAGDYRFEQKPIPKCRTAGYSAFYLTGIKRPDDRPFTILGNGVTFWTPTTENGRGSAIYLNECDNVSIVGITVDSDIPNDIEGRLTAVDLERNRIEMELLPGTITDEKKIIGGSGFDARVIPFKANGRQIAEMFSIDGSGWPAYNFLSTVEKSEKENRYWLTFRKKALVNVIEDPKWEGVFGAQGTWKTGDGVAVLFGAGGAFCLVNSKQVVMKDLTSHIATFSVYEFGGFGAHKWTNVKMLRRPGTNQLLASGGNLTAALKHGSLYDGLVMGATNDDAVNMQGYMGYVKALNQERNVLTLDRRPELFLPGDEFEFYSKSTGEWLGSTKVASVRDNVIGIEGSLQPDIDTVAVRYPQYECSDWTMRNCIFLGSYQRIMIKSGPGLFENNICRGVGSAMKLTTNITGYEGGKLHDVKIRGNVFIDSGASPNFNGILAGFWAQSARPMMHQNVEISGNIIMNTGSNAIVGCETDGLVIRDNIIINPLRATVLLQPGAIKRRQAILIENSRKITVSGNYLVESSAVAKEDPKTGSKFVNSDVNPEHSENTSILDPQNQVQAYVYKLLDDSPNKLDLQGMYEKTAAYVRTFKNAAMPPTQRNEP